jgi:hypothetical protein
LPTLGQRLLTGGVPPFTRGQVDDCYGDRRCGEASWPETAQKWSDALVNWKVHCCLVALLTLSGCGRSAESRYLLEAMKAYQAGDVAAFRSAAKRFDAAYPHDARSTVGCTQEAFRARRMDLYRKTLAQLDQPTVLAMAEEARLIYFQDAGIAGIAEQKLIDLEKVCGRKDADLADRANEDIFARVADARTMIDSWQAWKKDLGWRCGPQWKARLTRAARDLRLHGVPASRWNNG